MGSGVRWKSCARAVKSATGFFHAIRPKTKSDRLSRPSSTFVGDVYPRSRGRLAPFPAFLSRLAFRKWPVFAPGSHLRIEPPRSSRILQGILSEIWRAADFPRQKSLIACAGSDSRSLRPRCRAHSSFGARDALAVLRTFHGWDATADAGAIAETPSGRR